MIFTNDPHRYALMTDISEHQRGASVAAYGAAGFGLISLRCQFGGNFIDRQFDTFSPAAAAAGLKRLYYVWVLPTRSAADHIKLMRESHARHGAPELGYMLDVEDTENLDGVTKESYRRLVAELVNEALRLSGKLPVIYTAGWYWDRHLAGVDDFASCPLIVASYPFQRRDGSESKAHPADFRNYGSWAFAAPYAADTAVPRTGGWETWDGWQYTSLAGQTIPGFISTGRRGLDMNLLKPSFVAKLTGAIIPGQTRPFPSPTPVIVPTLEDLMQPRFLRSDGAQFLLGPNGDDKVHVSPAWADLANAAGGPLIGGDQLPDIDAKLAALLDGGSPRDVGGVVSAQVQQIVRDESNEVERLVGAVLTRLDTLGGTASADAAAIATAVADVMAARLAS